MKFLQKAKMKTSLSSGNNYPNNVLILEMFSENLTESLVVKMLLADLSYSYWINKMYSPVLVIYKKYLVL